MSIPLESSPGSRDLWGYEMDLINSVLQNEKALPLVGFVVFAFVFAAIMNLLLMAFSIMVRVRFIS